MLFRVKEKEKMTEKPLKPVYPDIAIAYEKIEKATGELLETISKARRFREFIDEKMYTKVFSINIVELIRRKKINLEKIKRFLRGEMLVGRDAVLVKPDAIRVDNRRIEDLSSIKPSDLGRTCFINYIVLSIIEIAENISKLIETFHVYYLRDYIEKTHARLGEEKIRKLIEKVNKLFSEIIETRNELTTMCEEMHRFSHIIGSINRELVEKYIELMEKISNYIELIGNSLRN